MDSKKDIYSFWVHYTTKNEEIYFRKFITGLVSIWESQLNLDWSSDDSLPKSISIKPDVGPALSRLPEELLPAIGKFLYVTKDRMDKASMTSDELKDAELLVKTLILISRNFSNIPSVAATDYVHLIISIASSVLLTVLNNEMDDNLEQGISFCITCAHLLECLYDPYFTWRYFKKSGKLVEGVVKPPKASPSALLHIEVIPFIFQHFEQKISEIVPTLAFELLNVLGSVVSGSQGIDENNYTKSLKNSLIGVCPATVCLLVSIISNNKVDIHIRTVAVKCLTMMIYSLLSIEPHQRQIEISTLLEQYRGCISKLIPDNNESSEDKENVLMLCNMIDVISMLINMVNKENVLLIRCLIVQNYFLESILDSLEKFKVCTDLSYSCFNAIANIIKTEDFSKERMVRINGYARMFRKLKLIENLDTRLLTALVEMAIEEKYENGRFYKLENAKLIVPLLQLLPSLDSINQEWLISIILSVCSCNLQCKWKAIRCGTIHASCETLKNHELLSSSTVDQLISLIEILASVSISSSELKCIFNLFLVSDNKLCPYYLRLLQVLSSITRGNNLNNCRSYFDIQSNTGGISVPDIKKWPGSVFGFTFHSWFSLNKIDTDKNELLSASSSFRRHIFSLFTTTKQGMQVNISANNNLVIIINTKKEFLAVSLFDFTFEENRWYCLDVSYMPSKRPFAQNQITIFIDGIQQLVATAKFAHISENFIWCRIGAPIEDVTLETDVQTTTSAPVESERGGILPSFISHVPSYITLPLRSSNSVNPYVKSYPPGMQTTIFGPSVALYGQMGNIKMFQEPLTALQIRLLYETGINGDIFSNVEENMELFNLQAKLVFSYSPLACAFDCTVDLCSKYKIDGRTTAPVCCLHCLKEIINAIGGVNVFLPFFETKDYSSDTTKTPTQNISVEDYSDMSDFAISNFRNVSEVQLEESPVAVIIIIIKQLLKDLINQEYFLKRHGFAMLGRHLGKVSVHLMDIPVLVSICMLAESVAISKNSLYQRTFYQNILFNFDVWSRCNFEVQLGHIQFLHSFIKKDKKFFKKRFGVQFLLDITRKYLSTNDMTKAEATKSVRVAIIGIINYFIQKEVSIQEINAIVNYVIYCQQEVQIIEILEVLIGHLQNRSCTDQLYLLLYEPHTADLFYALLLNPDFGIELKRTVLRLFSVLLRTERVYERSKHRLQLQDHTPVGLYPGLINSFLENDKLLADLTLMMLDQMFIIDYSGCYAGALILLDKLSGTSLNIKIEAARKILAVVFMKPNAPTLFAKQISWQDSIARLLVRHPIKNPDINAVSIPHRPTNISLNKPTEPSKTYPSLLKDVTSILETDFKDATGTVGSLVSGNLQLAAYNITSAAENVSSMVAENIHYAATNISSAAENVHHLVSENIQFAADSISSVAENVTSAVTDNITSAAGNISSVVGSAYSMITQKTTFERTISPESGKKPFNLPHGGDDTFTLINFDDLSLSNRSLSNGSIDEISSSNRSQSSYGKSPSHASKDSISVNSIKSGSNDSDVFDENEDEQVIFDILDPWKMAESENTEDEEQELCNTVTNILFTVMWRGYDIHNKSAWKERGQVIACMNMLGLNNALYGSHLELKLKLLEMMMQAALIDILDSSHSVEPLQVRTENAFQILRWVCDLVVLDANRNTSKKMSVKFLDSIVALLDALMIFRENTYDESNEMVKISFSILLKNVANEETELCAIAAAKLHTVIQTRKISDINEGCYILYLLNEIIYRDLNDQNIEHYSFIVPLVKTLISKLTESLFPGQNVLTEMNVSNAGLGFYESFQKICKNEKWVKFLELKVKPNHDKYKNSLSSELNESMNIFWAECYEAYKLNLQHRNELVAESRRRFHDIILTPFLQRRHEELVRYANVLNQYRNHRVLLKKKWEVQKNYLIGSRRAWKDCTNYGIVHWRLSHHENFSRMRLKLIPNLHFNSHKDASNLRDNTGWSKMRLSEEMTLPLNISQAVLRRESDSSSDQFADTDLIVDQLEENEMENKFEMTQSTEKLLITTDCELVTLMSVIKGKIEVTTYNFYFYDLSQIKEDADRYDFKWSINKLREIYLRRYNLCKTALEFFLTDQTNYFLNFKKEVRNTVFTTIIRLRPPNLLYHNYKSPSDLLKSSDLTQKWVNREISNFDYLMQLNTIAGRTYNDLSQYPVFPWILADYESEELDLNNPATFRDLSKPIGVVNPDNVPEVENKYNTFEDPCGIIAKFHYGTHYSNSAGVLHYLVRVEPFTTLHVDLQSGRFDVADRQFHSIPQTWKLLMENPNDVKELIPEFFYFPEFLKNINEFDLGVLQGTKEKVDDVILPKWASSPEDFIYKHRKALESEYVSSHLHEWIDLIFGFKQRGPEAIKAINVFYYCSYEGAVDLEAIEDQTEREAVEGMINNFGQTPSQLLKEPHPSRLSLSKSLTRMLEVNNIKKPDLTLFFDQLAHFQVEMTLDRDPIVFVNSPRSIPKGFLSSSMPDVLISVSRNGFVGMHSWSPYDRHSTKGFSVTVDESVNNAKWRRDVSGSFHPSIKLHSKLFVVSHDYKFLFSAGHWDSSIKMYSLTKNKYSQSLYRHTDVVTCLAADSCGWYLISGSKDRCSIVWDINRINVQPAKPYQLLHGHEEPITCVSIATELDMAVSGSQDGTVNVYTIHEGFLVHTLTPDGCVSPIADVTFVTISVQGHIAFSITDKINHSIHVYSVNGVNLGSKYVLGQVTGLTTVNDCVVVTDDAGDLTISRLLGLHPMYNIPLHIPIQTVVATNGNSHLLVPLRDGHLVVIGLPNK